MRSVDVLTVPLGADDGDPDGYRTASLRLGPELGASKLGATVYELPPGQSICPYHYEWGNEEWLLVLSGVVVLRHPDGEDALGPGAIVCFPEGPDGAHKLTNRTDRAARLLLASTKLDPSVAVYPDSDKVGIWPAPGCDPLIVRRESGVDYWDRELGASEPHLDNPVDRVPPPTAG